MLVISSCDVSPKKTFVDHLKYKISFRRLPVYSGKSLFSKNSSSEEYPPHHNHLTLLNNLPLHFHSHIYHLFWSLKPVRTKQIPSKQGLENIAAKTIVHNVDVPMNKKTSMIEPYILIRQIGKRLPIIIQLLKTSFLICKESEAGQWNKGIRVFGKRTTYDLWMNQNLLEACSRNYIKIFRCPFQ